MGELPRGQDVCSNANRRRTTASRQCTPASRRASPATRAAGRAKNLPALLAAALNEKVTVTENGKRRQVTKRVIARLVKKSASAELRATKMLIDMLRDIENRAEQPGWEIPVQPDRQRGDAAADLVVTPQYVQRLPWAAQRANLDSRSDGG